MKKEAFFLFSILSPILCTVPYTRLVPKLFINVSTECNSEHFIIKKTKGFYLDEQLWNEGLLGKVINDSYKDDLTM